MNILIIKKKIQQSGAARGHALAVFNLLAPMLSLRSGSLGVQTRSAQRNNNLQYKKSPPQLIVPAWRYYNTFSISEKICSLNEKELKKRNVNDARILTHWQDIVGDEFANKIHPKQIKIVRTDGQLLQKILYCFSENRHFVNEFVFYKKDLLERLNLYFGNKKEVFVDIKISF